MLSDDLMNLAASIEEMSGLRLMSARESLAGALRIAATDAGQLERMLVPLAARDVREDGTVVSLERERRRLQLTRLAERST